ncbi:MAG: winged helix-turn-helix transcriptional regulator [Abditibacteriota bacterium]|nr:winged helix-turn-helix transcriptional regulator [Abditibacteriota bacterium]
MNKSQNIYDYLVEYIKDHKPGDKLPSENSLSRELNISRNTIRSAIFSLSEKGYIKTKHGSGSYITNPKIKSQKKYILISADKDRTLGLFGYAHRTIMNKINEYLKAKNYNPYIYLIDDENKNKLPFDINDIAGYFALPENKFNYDLLKKAKIPRVNVGDYVTYNYPAVIMNYQKYFFLLEELVQKYNLKNIVVLTLVDHIKENYPHTFTSYAINRYYEKKYYLRSVSPSPDMKSSNYVLEHAIGINTCPFVPETFIFLDDTIFKGAIEVFKHSDRLKHSKIITHSNEDIEFPDNVCRISFNLDEVAQKSSELMISLLNKEPLIEYILPINPYLINEEALK